MDKDGKKQGEKVGVVFTAEQKIRTVTAHVGDEVTWDFGDLTVNLVFNDPGLIDASKVFDTEETGDFTGKRALVVQDLLVGDSYTYTLPYKAKCASAALGYLEGESHPVMIIKKRP